MAFCFFILKALPKHDVSYDLSPDISIEARGKFTTLHMKFLTQDGRGELHVERLVTDDKVFGVARYHRTHHMLPALDEAILIERSLKTLLTEKLAYEVAYGFGVGTLHFF